MRAHQRNQGAHAQLTRLRLQGYEVSGVIVKTGADSRTFEIGDEVVGLLPIDEGGGCAEYVIGKFYYFVKKPKVLFLLNFESRDGVFF